MRVLITGASGFIGRHLSRHLAEHGYEVVGVDRETRPDGAEHRRDLAVPGAFAELLADVAPDRVIHLAAQVGRLFGEDDLARCIRDNTSTTTFIAHACGAARVPLVYASTSEIYGDNAEAVCDEIAGPFALPHNLYGLSKRWGEEACELYAPRDLVSLRLSMPYGPGVPPGRGRAALPNVLWQAHNRLPIPIHIGAMRSWCYVEDTVRGIRLIMESAERGPFNLGRDDCEVSMLAAADRACEMTGAPRALIQMIPAPTAQTVVKRLSTERLRGLGWRPEVEVEEGMERVLEWVVNYDAESRWVGPGVEPGRVEAEAETAAVPFVASVELPQGEPQPV